MSLEHSRKLIHDIAAMREAEDYIEGLLQDPEMRAMAEAAEQQTHTGKWDVLIEENGLLVSNSPQEREP